MANQKTTLTNSSHKEGIGWGGRVKIAMALTVALVSTGAKPSDAADFRHTKKIFVPASSIPRRYDYTSSTGRMAGVPAGYETPTESTYTPTYPDTSSSSSGSISSSSKSGLVPPPPPVTPSLLPSSLAHDLPVTSAPPVVSHASGSTASGYQQVNADPTRSTSMDRHSGNTKSYKLGAENSTVSQVITRAETLEKEGKLQEAQDLLERYEKTYPNNSTLDNKLSQVSLDRAKYYMRHDDYVEGAKQARIALAHNANNTEAKHALDQILRHHGIDPNHSLSRVKMGDVLFSQGKMKEARVEYDAALKLDHSHSAHIGLGNIDLREHKLKEAKSHYQLALEKDPESSVALRQLGIVRYKQKDVVGANADLSRALVLNQEDKLAGQTLIELWQRQVSLRPKDANSHLGLARAYQLSGDLKAAQNSYRTVVSIDPNHPNLPAARQSFKLALARQEAQKTYDAAKTLDASGALSEAYGKAAESVSLSPGDVKFRLYQAELAERLGNYPDAKNLYMDILRQDPKNLHAAQKIKSISELLASAGATQGLRGPITGLAAEAGSLSSMQGATPGSIASALSAPRSKGEGPALPTIPRAPGVKGPSPDPVNNMTGFLSDLRGFMFQQKKDLQKQEDTILENIGAKAKSDGGGGGGKNALADLPPLPDVPGMPKNMISSSDIQKLLASTKGGKSSSGTATAIGTAAAGAAAGVAAGAISAPAGAKSSQDISKLSGGGSTAPPIAPLASSLPPLDDSTMNAIKGQLPPGINTQDISKFLGGGMSGVPMANPPLSIGSAPESSNFSTPGVFSRSNSILSNPPRDSETVLKVAETPAAQAEEMPPVAPSRFAQAAEALSNSPAGEHLAGLAAQAQSLSPEAMAGIARSLGMEPSHVAAIANQAANAAPALINQGIANLKQEDIDKVANLVKHHVALKQQAMGLTPKTAPTKDIVTTKATPQMVKKVDLKKPALAKTAAAKNAKPAVNKTAIAAKPATTVKSSVAPAVTPPMVAPIAESAAPASAAFDGLAAGTAALGAGEMAAADNLKPAIPVLNPDDGRLSSLEAQNQQLSSQLEETRKQLQELKDSLMNSKSAGKVKKLKAAKPVKEVKTNNNESAPPAVPTSSMSPIPVPAGYGQPVPVDLNNPAVQAAMSNPALAQYVSNQGSAIPNPALPAGYGKPVPVDFNNPAVQSAIANPALAQAITNSAGAFFSPVADAAVVNLELAGISVKSRGVRLNVVLKNGTGKELAVPSSTKAIVRMVGAPDQVADVKFPIKSLTPGQEARGYISVSGHKLDPSADVFIPKLMSSEQGPSDVHLTVPISALNGLPH